MVVASGSRSRVTVLGDACHPMTCFKGQGANQALADAVLLARRVAEANDMPKALRRFEREMVQRAGPRAAASRCAARLLHSPRGLTAELPSFARVDDSAALCEPSGNGVRAATPDPGAGRHHTAAACGSANVPGHGARTFGHPARATAVLRLSYARAARRPVLRAARRRARPRGIVGDRHATAARGRSP